MFPLAPAGLGSAIKEDRSTHGWLDLAADALADPEGRDRVTGPFLDLLVVIAVLADDCPVAELFGGEVLFLEGGHLVGSEKEKLDKGCCAPDAEKPHNGFPSRAPDKAVVLLKLVSEFLLESHRFI